METTSNQNDKVMSFINTSKTPTIHNADREALNRIKIIPFNSIWERSIWESEYPKS